jgi:hypothetical protein
MNIIGLILISTSLFFLSYFIGRSIASFIAVENEEKFVISFGFSFLLFYLIGFLGYVLHLDSYAYVIITVLLIIVSLFILFVWPKSFKFTNDIFYLFIFLLFFLFIVFVQALFPIYSGSLWSSDWFEHYNRALFFLKHKTINTHFIGGFFITARPPLFNAAASFLMSISGKEFWSFQIIASLFNTTLLLSCFLIVKKLADKYKTKLIFLICVVVFFLNPSFITEATFTWTKNLTAYFILLGVYFYLKFRNKEDSRSIVLASVFLACAELTHYSAIQYILIILFDFLILTIFSKKFSWKKIILPALIFFIIVLPWYGFAIINFGINETFFGNTTFQWQKYLTLWQIVYKEINNVVKTLFPIAGMPYIRIVLKEANPFLSLYDYTFQLYATTVPGQLTITLALVLFFSLLRNISSLFGSFKRNILANVIKYIKKDNFFWFLFCILGFIIGILVNPDVQSSGIAQITLLPVTSFLLCLAIIFLIRTLKLKSLISYLVIAGMSIEIVLGILLRIYVAQFVTNPRYGFISNPKLNFIWTHNENYLLKANNKLIFLSDKFPYPNFFLTLLILAEIACLIYLLIRINGFSKN